jgi:uncharacterized membrane protein
MPSAHIDTYPFYLHTRAWVMGMKKGEANQIETQACP